MHPCNRIYYSTVHWRLNMFVAAYRSSSGALTVFAASGLHTHVVTGHSQVWVGTGCFYWIVLRYTDPLILNWKKVRILLICMCTLYYIAYTTGFSKLIILRCLNKYMQHASFWSFTEVSVLFGRVADPLNNWCSTFLENILVPRTFGYQWLSDAGSYPRESATSNIYSM
jgi:hypothetical protein